jgi:CRISPR-associated protein Cas1
MSFKQLFIQNKSYLSYQNNSMSVKNEDKQTLICLDDIDIIVVENPQCTITSALLSHLAKANVTVVFVDAQFMPSAVCTGLYKNSRTSKIQRIQISQKKAQT